MRFFTSSTFRACLAELRKKPREGYSSVVKDLCEELKQMADQVLRDTNDRVRQFATYRIVKLRIPNSGLRLSKSNGFRLIYWVSLLTDEVVLMSVYPKRGPKGTIDLVDREYARLVLEVTNESQVQALHQVDINNSLAEQSTKASLTKEFTPQ